MLLTSPTAKVHLGIRLAAFYSVRLWLTTESQSDTYYFNSSNFSSLSKSSFISSQMSPMTKGKSDFDITSVSAAFSVVLFFSVLQHPPWSLCLLFCDALANDQKQIWHYSTPSLSVGHFYSFLSTCSSVSSPPSHRGCWTHLSLLVSVLLFILPHSNGLHWVSLGLIAVPSSCDVVSLKTKHSPVPLAVS